MAWRVFLRMLRMAIEPGACHMSSKTFAPSLALLLAHEGGFSNVKADPGGPTNKGVTQKIYDRHRQAIGAPLQSVKLITDAEVSQIYKDDYWDMIEADKLPAGVDYAMFDYGVNSGNSKAVKDMQRAINANANFYGVSGVLKVDGDMGQSTVTAIQKAGETAPDDLIVAYCARRLAFMKTLSTWKKFGTGWQRRVEGAHDGAQDDDDGVVDLACKMAAVPIVVANLAEPADTPPVPANGIVVTPPAPIGARQGELPSAKAFGSQVALMRTVQGAGAALAAAGVTGNTAMDAAGTVKGHINSGVLGQIALILFVLLTLGGVGLVLYKFFVDRAEKKSS